MERATVIGGTGEIGRRVVERLVRRGVATRVLAREPERARARLGPLVEIHRGDIRDPGSLRGLGSDPGPVFCCLGSRTYYGANGTAAVDGIGMQNLIAAVDRTPHLLVVSAFGLDRRSVFLDLFSAALNGYFRGKAEAEEQVRRSGAPYTIVRPVQFVSRPPRSGPRLNQAEPLSLLRTISRDLVAEVLVGCALVPEAMGRTFELCEGGDAPLEAQLPRMRPDPERPRPERTPLL